jgi:hydrogenase large subunit
MVDLFLAGDPLIVAWMRAEGPDAWLRQLTRLHRPVVVMQLMRQTIAELRAECHEPAIVWPTEVPDEARIRGRERGTRNPVSLDLCPRRQNLQPPGGYADNLECVAARRQRSPRALGESFLGLTICDPDNPVQLGHIVRSHDACLVCTTHMIRTGQRATHLSF